MIKKKSKRLNKYSSLVNKQVLLLSYYHNISTRESKLSKRGGRPSNTPSSTTYRQLLEKYGLK